MKRGSKKLSSYFRNPKILLSERKRSLWARACCIPKSWNSTKAPRRCFPWADSVAQRIKVVAQHTAPGEEGHLHHPVPPVLLRQGGWEVTAGAWVLRVPIVQEPAGSMLYSCAAHQKGVYSFSLICRQISALQHPHVAMSKPFTTAQSLCINPPSSWNKEWLVSPLSGYTGSLGEL